MSKVYGFAEFGGPEKQEFWDRPTPTPGPSELLITVKAAGVNPVDTKIRSGAYQAFFPVDLPAVIGQEASGVVLEVGKDVEGFSVGDEVFGNTAPGSGGFGEHAVLTAASTAKKPAHVSFADAAVLPVAGVTAFAAVRQLGLVQGQSLLILGVGGGVGVAATQIARDLGVNVLGTGSEGKRALVQSLDATLIDYTKGDVAAQVRDLLPTGVDGILDLIGGDALREAADLVTDRSKLLTAADPQTAAELGGEAVTQERAGVLAQVAQLVSDGKLAPHVIDVLPFEKAGDAIAAVESGHSMGKVVVEIS